MGMQLPNLPSLSSSFKYIHLILSQIHESIIIFIYLDTISLKIEGILTRNGLYNTGIYNYRSFSEKV